MVKKELKNVVSKNKNKKNLNLGLCGVTTGINETYTYIHPSNPVID
jgi:aspartate ammonia-lyase